MYILPDAYATTYDTAGVTSQATDGTLDTALAAVEGVSAFGTMAPIVAAAMEAETANAFTASGVASATSATAVTLSGETTAAGYVICYMDKEGTSTAPVEEAAARLLQEEAAETETAAEDTTAETDAADTTADADATAVVEDDHAGHDHEEDFHEEDYNW